MANCEFEYGFGVENLSWYLILELTFVLSDAQPPTIAKCAELISASYLLYKDQKKKISYLMNELKVHGKQVGALEIQVEELSKGHADLVVYSMRHEKWLDGIDNRLPNYKFED